MKNNEIKYGFLGKQMYQIAEELNCRENEIMRVASGGIMILTPSKHKLRNKVNDLFKENLSEVKKNYEDIAFVENIILENLSNLESKVFIENENEFERYLTFMINKYVK